MDIWTTAEGDVVVAVPRDWEGHTAELEDKVMTLLEGELAAAPAIVVSPASVADCSSCHAFDGRATNS